MKVLLTGASGFVGSHILDALCTRQVPSCVLLRPTSDRSFIQGQLSRVDVRTGSISDQASVASALKDVTHVIHCAGATKAQKNCDFVEVNQVGTRNVVKAVNSRGSQIERLLHISSLAVSGPATPAKPAREQDPCAPISEYGKSKLGAELEVRNHCRVPYTILRPPAVYGPRDNGFFPMFQAVKRHVLPRPKAGQTLSVVYGPDLAGAVATCFDHPNTVGKVYFVASEELVTGRQMADEIASMMRVWTIPCPLPPLLLWPICLGQELFSRATGRAMLLNLQKYAELRASGWVCDPSQLRNDTGYRCPTDLRAGIAATLDWYNRNQWLP